MLHKSPSRKEVKATFYISEEIAKLLHLVAFQNKMKKSTIVEEALREYFHKAKEDKLKRFHKLVDKCLDGNLKGSEQAELEVLELSFDEADAAIMASLERERKEIDSQTLQIGQLKEIGKKLDELLYQFADNVQNQKEA